MIKIDPEHLSCVYYEPARESSFERREFKQGKKFTMNNQVVNKIMLIVKGKATVDCPELELDKVEISAGEMGVIPVNTLMGIEIMEDMQVVFLGFDRNIVLCNRYSLENLFPHCKDVEDNSFKIAMNERITDYLSLLDKCLKDGLHCSHFQNFKKNEFFILLRAYYSKESLARLFKPVVSPSMNFREFVEANFKKVNKVSDFARLANCSQRVMERKFKANFNESAGQWLAKKKASIIWTEIAENQKDLMGIATEHGFASQSHFTAFCKKHFNETPKKLRDKFIAKAIEI